MFEQIKIKNKKFFLITFGIHFLITIISSLYYFATNFAFHDSIKPSTIIPLNIKIAEIINIIFTAPLNSLSNKFMDNLFSLLPPSMSYLPILLIMIINSILAAYVLILIFEKVKDKFFHHKI